MKVVVTHVPAGSGHQRAAEAIAEALGRAHPEVETVLLNALDGADSCYRWIFTRGYLGMTDRAPALWGAAYGVTDLRPFRSLSQRIHRLSNALHGKVLAERLGHQAPEIVIGTHFFPVEVAATLKSQGKLNARVIAVLTDYLPHVVWTTPGVDLYVVGSEPTRQALLERRIPPERIEVLGIPIHPKFSDPLERSTTARRLNLEPGRFTILVAAGGFGNGPVLSLVRSLEKIGDPLQVLVVAGKNPTLLNRLQAPHPRLSHRLVPYPFVENMEALMSVSDLMVTKPGGLSCAEALAKGLPLVLLPSIPGQESRNAQVMQALGLALIARRVAEVPNQVLTLLKNPDLRRALSEKARRFSHPDAAFRIAQWVMQQQAGGKSSDP